MTKRQVIHKWRPALKLLASSADGWTQELLFARGFTDATIRGLVDAELVAGTTKRVSAGQSNVDVTWFMITRRGRAVLEGATLPAKPNELGRPPF